MTSSAHITVYGGDYEHTLELGGVHEDVNVAYERTPVRRVFEEMLETRRFEACEFSLANYITLRGNGEDWLKAVPVFPYRAFRHDMAVTRRESPIETLDQLAGKRVAVEDYSMTAAVWFRGLLHDECGIDARDIAWVTRSKQRFAFPASARVEKTDTDLEDLVTTGAVDAMLGFTFRDSALPANERRLRTVLKEPHAAAAEYYARTGIYPIMHTAVIRSDVHERMPRLPDALFAAYTNAKDAAYRRQLGATLLPWGKQHWAREFELFGGDPLPYGLTAANTMVVEKLTTYLQQQGFTDRVPAVEELFVLA